MLRAEMLQQDNPMWEMEMYRVDIGEARQLVGYLMQSLMNFQEG